MKLADALSLINKTASTGKPFHVFMVCGFEPVYFETFLKAHLQKRIPERTVAIRAGLFGDFLGNVNRISAGPCDAVAAVLEWSDVDPRLGFRSLGGWGDGELADLADCARTRLGLILGGLSSAAAQHPLALSLPTLPLPPMGHGASWGTSAHEVTLRHSLCAFAAEMAAKPNVRIVSPQHLDQLSAPGERLDLRAELTSGQPYSLSHASAVAEALSRLILPSVPKKGVITDLDDCLWRGILGEEGIQGITWDLDHHSHMHALYQQLLRSLAESGALIAVATKNEPALVEEALRHQDLLLPRDRLFPVEAHWGPKSESVRRILDAWNIGAEDAVFVDDSAMELAEVGYAYPGIECVEFPTRNEAGIHAVLIRLRDLFGKEAISEEDTIRLESVRNAHGLRASLSQPGVSLDDFLSHAEAEATLDFRKDPVDPRALELVNKTNQFNLNGIRYSEAEWRDRLQHPSAFLLLAAYKDRYGPLGKIAVLSGHTEARRLHLETWAMSCRAFGRRIEFLCLEQLFQAMQVEDITFDFRATSKNVPFRDFLLELVGSEPGERPLLSRASFRQRCPKLFQTVRESANA